MGIVENQKFKNTKVIPPLKENDLAKELKIMILHYRFFE